NGYHAFSFVRFDGHTPSLQIVCYALSAFGLALSIRRYDQPPYLLLAVAAIGHIASIPFAPPIDAGLRVYAASMPILALLVAVGGGGLADVAIRMMRARSPGLEALRAPYPSLWPGTSVTFGVVLATLAIIGPLITRMVSHAPRVAESPCPSGQEAVYVRVSPGSSLRAVDNSQGVPHKRVVVPEIRLGDLRKTAGMVEIKNDVD